MSENTSVLVMVRENLNSGRFVRAVDSRCKVCGTGEGRFVAVQERVRHHRRDGALASLVLHKDSLVCCGLCGLTLVRACEAAGVSVFGSLAFSRATGLALR